MLIIYYNTLSCVVCHIGLPHTIVSQSVSGFLPSVLED